MGGAGRSPTVATGSVEIVPDFTKFRANVERQFRRSNLRNEIKKELSLAERALSERMQSMGNKLSNAGSTLTKGVTLPILAIGGVSLKTAIDFETAFTGVRKTVDGTEKDFAKLERGIRDMAVATGTGANQLAAIAEAAGALGIKTPDILKFVDVVNKLDVATDLTAESAANALGKLKNVLDLSVDDLDNLSAAVVDLGNTGSSTEPEIVALALRIASAGKNAGLSTAEILAFSAAVADAGIEAEAGGTALSKSFADIAVAVADGGKDLARFAKVADMSAKDFAKAWETDPAAATAAFIEGLQRINKEAGSGELIKTLKNLGITEVRQRRTLQDLANAQVSVADKIRQSSKAYKEATAAQREFDKFQKTNAQQIARLKTGLSEVALELGKALVPALQEALPVLRDMIGHVRKGVEWFKKLDPGTRGTLIKIALGIAALGPALRIVGPGIKGLGSLIGILAKLRRAKTVNLGGLITGSPTVPGGGFPGKTAAGKGAIAGAGALTAAIFGAEVGTAIYNNVVKPAQEAKWAAEDVKLAWEANLRVFDKLAQRGVLSPEQVDDVERVVTRLKELGQLSPGSVDEMFSPEALGVIRDVAEKGGDVKRAVEAIAVAAENFDGKEFLSALEFISNTSFGTPIASAEELADKLGISLEAAQKLKAELERLDGAKVVVNILLEPTLPSKGGQKVSKKRGKDAVEDIFGDVLEGRAFGGPVKKNRPYLVGERGVPELFVPEADGSIVPLDERGSRGGGPITLEIPVVLPNGRELARATATYSSEEFESHRRSHA